MEAAHDTTKSGAIDHQPLTRRSCLAGLAGGALLVGSGGAGLAPQTASAEQRSGSPVWADRAEAAWDALRKNFAVNDGSGLYREHYPVSPEDRKYSFEWPFSQAHAAVQDLVGIPVVGRSYRPALTRHRRAQKEYWDDEGSTGRPGFASYPVAPYGDGGDFFYDDSEWVGLLDIQHWNRFHDDASLREAQRVFDLVISGWDDDTTHAAPGGVFWTQAPWSQDRNTVSNMPAALLGLGLYRITGMRIYLDWSVRMYEWTNRNLQRDNSLYNDHLGLEGAVDPTVWSYNQGIPIAVNCLLADLTGQRRYLREARRIAAAAADFYGTAALDGQPVFFNSIYFKCLLLLEYYTGGRESLQTMRAYGERLWRNHRDRSTGLFQFAGDGTTQMIEQAAVTQIFAVLGWPRHDYRLLA
ncbi:glycoside hydrolase family 76 protein [Microlunatus ginsengisoli]|uniref:Glycosyl hydrolase family 76 n=1 Tax=Microlunatus ginsengisoli TaxID=363863 RepID=A0ABP7AMB5_9ACTN